MKAVPAFVQNPKQILLLQNARFLLLLKHYVEKIKRECVRWNLIVVNYWHLAVGIFVLSCHPFQIISGQLQTTSFSWVDWINWTYPANQNVDNSRLSHSTKSISVTMNTNSYRKRLSMIWRIMQYRGECHPPRPPLLMPPLLMPEYRV